VGLEKVTCSKFEKFMKLYYIRVFGLLRF
jgi:hypothetical protein